MNLGIMSEQDTIKSTDKLFFEDNDISKNKTFDCVNSTLNNCNGGELYFENTDFETLYFTDSRIQNISQSSSQGFGFRSIKDDTVAFSCSDNISYENIINASKTVNSIINSNNKDDTVYKKNQHTKPLYISKNPLTNLEFSKKIPLKKSIKSEVKTTEQKSDGLRITKNNEAKPEIKKVKKQETEKREYKIKDYVVYPKHGVGQITEFKKINIGGIDVETYVIKFEKDKANGMVPVNKQLHLRPLATINQVNKCISILKSKPKIKRSMWSRRAQEYEAKISSGKIYELAEVVRDLNKGDDLMVDQSYSERQLFEKAYERILSEFQIILNLSLEDTQKKLDKALKRNLNTQPKPEAAPIKQASSDLPEEEAVSENEEDIEE